MHQFCKEPDRRLFGKTVMASSTRHLAGGEKQSKSVYGELCSAVTSTRQATARRGPGANGAPKTPSRFPQLSSAAGVEGGKSVGSQLWHRTRAGNTATCQPIAQGNLLLPSPE